MIPSADHIEGCLSLGTYTYGSKITPDERSGTPNALENVRAEAVAACERMAAMEMQPPQPDAQRIRVTESPTDTSDREPNGYE